MIDRWDARDGGTLSALRADSRQINQLAFSPGASLVAATDELNVIRLWDTKNWIPVRLTPSSEPTTSPGFLAIGGNGAWLASGAATLDVWNLDIDSMVSKICGILRRPGQHGAESSTPLWMENSACASR